MSRVLSYSVITLVLTFLIGPFAIIIAAALSAGETLAFPPRGFSLRWFVKVFEIDSFRESFYLSMELAIFGTLAALVLGVPVAYAAARFVTIVPEIDMPGHSNAALASYAVLNESGERTELTPTVPFGSSSLWINGPDTARFVDDVVREVAALAPGPYLHIGGDEALTVGEEDYAAFLRMTQNIVESHGKTMVGWGEISGSGLHTPFIAQQWLMPLDALAARDEGAALLRLGTSLPRTTS